MYIWHRIDGQSKDCRPNGTETLYFAALQTGSSSGASDKIQMIQTAYWSCTGCPSGLCSSLFPLMCSSHLLLLQGRKRMGRALYLRPLLPMGQLLKWWTFINKNDFQSTNYHTSVVCIKLPSTGYRGSSSKPISMEHVDLQASSLGTPKWLPNGVHALGRQRSVRGDTKAGQ